MIKLEKNILCVSPSKSHDLADGNNTILKEWKLFETTVLVVFLTIVYIFIYFSIIIVEV